MGKRTSVYRRHQRQAHINRKKQIIKEQGGYWHFKHEGDLDKGKIHCSCPMCRRKSSDHASISSRRKAGSDIEELLDYGDVGKKAAYDILQRMKN